MKLKHFIERPILSMVISVVILVAGIIGLAGLAIEQYPDIAPPTIRVSTTYSGANAETVQKSVIVPLEEAINGVENMTYMTSSASNNGRADITVYFKQGSDPDMAAVNVQNSVSTATSLLPAEVTRVGVTTRKRQTSQLMTFGLYSPNGTYDRIFLTNYMSINIKPQIQRISGVGDVNVMGGDYAMRVWLKPDVMAQYELVPADIEAALSSQNIEASTGSIGEDSENVFQYTLKYRGRLETEDEFEEADVAEGGDARVQDVADDAEHRDDRHGSAHEEQIFCHRVLDFACVRRAPLLLFYNVFRLLFGEVKVVCKAEQQLLLAFHRQAFEQCVYLEVYRLKPSYGFPLSRRFLLEVCVETFVRVKSGVFLQVNQQSELRLQRLRSHLSELLGEYWVRHVRAENAFQGGVYACQFFCGVELVERLSFGKHHRRLHLLQVFGRCHVGCYNFSVHQFCRSEGVFQSLYAVGERHGGEVVRADDVRRFLQSVAGYFPEQLRLCAYRSQEQQHGDCDFLHFTLFLIVE